MIAFRNAIPVRRDEVVTPDGQVVEVPWWDTRDASYVKWAIFLGIIALAVGLVLMGRWHARRRLQAGRQPWRIEGWLLSRKDRATYDARFRDPAVTYNAYQPGQYPLQAMPPPPSYELPDGATKVDPSQWRHAPTNRPPSVDESGEAAPAYSPPPGPPPPAITATRREDANPYRL